MKTYGYGHQSIDEADIQSVVDVLRGDCLTCGPSVRAFEQAICAYTGAKYCVAVANATAGLHIAALAAVFLLRNVLPGNFEATIVAAAASLGLLTVYFAFRLSRPE